MPDNSTSVGETSDVENVVTAQTVDDQTVEAAQQDLAELRKKLADAKEEKAAKEVSTANEVVLAAIDSEKEDIQRQLDAMNNLTSSLNGGNDSDDEDKPAEDVDPQVLASPHFADSFNGESDTTPTTEVSEDTPSDPVDPSDSTNYGSDTGDKKTDTETDGKPKTFFGGLK